MIYRDDLAYIHDHGFSEFAESAAPGVIAMLTGLLLPVASGQSDSVDGIAPSGSTARTPLPIEITRSAEGRGRATSSSAVERRSRRAGPPASRELSSAEAADAPQAWRERVIRNELTGPLATGNAPAPLVVEAGCGSGILARELTKAGFAVLGFDASDAMLKLARRNAPLARFRRATFDAMRIPRCDAVIAMGEVLNHGTFDSVRTFVGNAAQALRKGGVLLFDIAERGSYPAFDEHRIGGEDWSVIAINKSDGGKLTRRILTFRKKGNTVRRDEEVHTLELYDRGELLDLLSASDFRTKVLRSYRTRRLPRGHFVYSSVRR